MKRCRTTVLVTDAGYKHTLGAVRALARQGYLVDAIGVSKSLCCWSRHLRHIAFDQRRFNEKHLGEFLRFLHETSYDVLLPIGARSVLFLAHNHTAVKRYCAMPLAAADRIALCMNKDRLYAFASDHGVMVPRTWLVATPQDTERVCDEARFPVVIKRRHEFHGRSVVYVNAPDALACALAVWKARNVRGEGVPLVQEFVHGRGCALFALYQDGSLKRAFMHRRIRELPASGGVSCCAESIFEDDLLQCGARLLDALHWHGVAMVEFKRDFQTGELWLMEVNPKFWGSLDLAIAAGVDFPSLAVRVALDEPLDVSLAYREGLRFHWPFGQGELLHVSERPRAAFSILRDCIDFRVRSNLWLTDPLPAARSILEDIGALTASR
jgi:predicted ATP-grasp superfamily ATP-dependent carboligase